jgi:hypothetical protein
MRHHPAAAVAANALVNRAAAAYQEAYDRGVLTQQIIDDYERACRLVTYDDW